MKFLPNPLLVSAALIALAGLACHPEATQEGERGNLLFSYSPADDSTDFDRPIAVGSEIRIHVEPADGRTFAEVIDVSTSNDTVLEADVASDASDAIDLVGRSAGATRLEVEVRDDAHTYGDEIELHTDDVHQISLGHRCTHAADAAYLRDYEATVGLRRHNNNGRQLVGSATSTERADESCQVDIVPPQEQTRPRCDEAGLHFSSFTDYGPVEIFPADGIATTPDSAPDLGVHVVGPDRIEFERRPVDELRVNHLRSLQLQAHWNDPSGPRQWEVCTNMELEIEILTPAVCRGRGGDLNFAIGPDDANQVQLRGERSGVCELDVYLQAPTGHFGPWMVEVDVVN